MSIQQHNTVWIFAAGMRRSASTLQYLLAKDLIEYVGGRAVGWVTHRKFVETYQALDGDFPFVLLKTHAFTPLSVSLADILFKKNRARALTIFRDPRDVAASMLGKTRLTETWDKVLEIMPVVLKEFTAWSALPDDKCLVQEYGKSNQSLLREIANFLDILYMPEFEETCLASHTLEAHQELIANYDGDYDKVNLFWYNHIDEGKIGRYKDELTSEQLAEIEKIVEDWKMKL